MEFDTKVIFEEIQLRKEVNEYGTIRYFNKDNYLHREFGPAVISSNYQSWFLNGKRHRLDGPARIYPSGVIYWYIFGEKYTEEDYWKEVERIKSGN